MQLRERAKLDEEWEGWASLSMLLSKITCPRAVVELEARIETFFTKLLNIENQSASSTISIETAKTLSPQQ